MAVEPAIGPVSRSQWEGFVGQPQNRNGEDFRVALDRDLLIGHAESSLRDQGRGRVRYCKLVVAPAYRRKGAASALMNSLLKIDQPDDKLSFQAVAASDWTAGTAFLTTLGFSYLESDLAMRCTQLVSPADTLSHPPSLEHIADPASVAAEVARIHNAAYRSDVAFRIFTPEEMAADLSGEDLWIARDSDQIIGFVGSALSRHWYGSKVWQCIRIIMAGGLARLWRIVHCDPSAAEAIGWPASMSQAQIQVLRRSMRVWDSPLDGSSDVLARSEITSSQ